MKMKKFLRWLPAVVIMAIIFFLSSTPKAALPQFGWMDVIIKKAGHVCGYGLLTVAYWYALGFERRCWWLAILLALIYAITDEFHQSFVPGRHATVIDVVAFDGVGASIGLILASRRRDKQPKKTKPVL